MFKKRNRFLSDTSPLRSDTHSWFDKSPDSPVIKNLKLEPTEELEDLEIPPSEEFESQQEELSAYLSNTNDEFVDKEIPPKVIKNTQFNIMLDVGDKKKRRAYSNVVGQPKMLLFDVMAFNKA